MTSSAQLDHLVVVAASLAEGVAWCEATLGVTPAPGGTHALMGTHNRLLRLASPEFARAYLEIIAIDPAARAPVERRRWFDMDDEGLRADVARTGPRLAHFVARVPDLRTALSAWASLGLDGGEAVAASRMTPRGLLQWRIGLRHDGRRLFDGALPILIEWGGSHPADDLPDAGVTLRALEVAHARAGPLRAAYEAIGLHGIAMQEAASGILAQLDTPRGRVALRGGNA